MVEFGPFERVYVENEWYDGPRAGLADIHGVPHRFQSLFDETKDEYSLIFAVWPVRREALELEIEQWRIFVDWNARYESGEAGTGSHPAHGGIDQRWDEIEALVQDGRTDVPLGARHAEARYKYSDRQRRYELSGPGYSMSWKFL